VVTAPIARWQRRITDFIALGIVTGALMEFCSEILGIRDTSSIVVLTLACVSQPILELLRDRRREHQPAPSRASAATALIAAAPWIVLGWFRVTHPHSVAWQTADVPAGLRVVGCVLACGVIVMRPMLRGTAVDPDDRNVFVPQLTVESQIVMISTLLVSGSVVAAGLTIYWLAAAGLQRLAWEGLPARLLPRHVIGA
jgi:hypothetical protein